MSLFSELCGSQSERTYQVRPASSDRIIESCPPMKTASGLPGSTNSAWLYQACSLSTSRPLWSAFGLTGAREEFTPSEMNVRPPSSLR